MTLYIIFLVSEQSFSKARVICVNLAECVVIQSTNSIARGNLNLGLAITTNDCVKVFNTPFEWHGICIQLK